MHTPSSETGIVAKSRAHQREKTSRTCLGVASPYLFCTTSRSRTAHSTQCTESDFCFRYLCFQIQNIENWKANSLGRVWHYTHTSFATVPSSVLQHFYKSKAPTQSNGANVCHELFGGCDKSKILPKSTTTIKISTRLDKSPCSNQNQLKATSIPPLAKRRA